MINEYRTAYTEEPKSYLRHEATTAQREQDRVLAKPSVASITIEQQHLLHELDKALSMLDDVLLPITLPHDHSEVAKVKERNGPESELYSMMYNNNSYINAIIHRIHTIRESVQV